jgi:glycosyltransferase involved in cell wall biosynthesis
VTAASRPRVLHLVPALFGPSGVVGGAERYSIELARHMAGVVPTRLATFGDRAEERAVGDLGLRVIARAWHVRGQRSNPWSSAIFGEIARADVVHCHQQHVLMSSTAAAFCRVTGRPVFATDLGGGGWDISAYTSTDAWFDGHLHISEYSRAVFGHAGNQRARVILGGVDAEKFSPGPPRPRDGSVLFVGRLLPHKGVADLVAALPGGMRLNLVGPAANASYLEDLRQGAAGKDVVFRHDADDAELVEAYRRALCTVLPSVYRTPDGAETKVPELLGQTLLESMACGTPVICTRVASMPEIVEDGRTGFVIGAGDRSALRDRLEWLAAHQSDAEAMGAAGREAVMARFQWTDVVRRCLDAYAAA